MNVQKGVFKNLYKNLITPVLKKDSGIDAEYLTNVSLSLLSFSSRKYNWPIVSSILKNLNEEFSVVDKRLTQNICGINFCNPIGLAAGFDKNGNAANIWKDFGFGFAELGTVTKFAQNGNPKPRLFRLAEEEAALNRMGFNNNGAENLVKNFVEQGIEFKKNRENICLGINFGKSKITGLSQAKDDYLTSLKLLIPYCDYAAINVSSPNTEGLRSFHDQEEMKKLLSGVNKVIKEKKIDCPIVLKISPDINDNEISKIVDLVRSHKIQGVVVSNTTDSNRDNLSDIKKHETGGLSGQPLKDISTNLIKKFYKETKGKIKIIGVGGVDSGKSAFEKITAGADAIQLYTGMVYKGPGIVKEIKKELISILKKENLKNISDAVGINA